MISKGAKKMEADFSNAVYYHLGAFPPAELNATQLLRPLASAVEALARYDVMLRQMRDSEILLSSLRRKEAVISSRMEGTITTLEEVLSVEADQQGDDDVDTTAYRHEAIEALAYSSAMRNAQYLIQNGGKISEHVIKVAHQRLLRFGRGAELTPGRYKTEQNYLADRNRRKILFVPISPEQLQPHMEQLIEYIDHSDDHPLIKAAVSHIEFEALHPFNDGNRRLGRMLITLFLWQAKVISAPHFYISEYFEENKDDYIDRMRRVSDNNDWTQWAVFFLDGLADQAARKCEQIERIQSLYDEMQDRFREVLSSKDFLSALNFVFEMPVFRSGNFVRYTQISRPTATRFLRLLRDSDLIRVIRPGAGRRATLYSFEPLLDTIRD